MKYSIGDLVVARFIASMDDDLILYSIEEIVNISSDLGGIIEVRSLRGIDTGIYSVFMSSYVLIHLSEEISDYYKISHRLPDNIKFEYNKKKDILVAYL